MIANLHFEQSLPGMLDMAVMAFQAKTAKLTNKALTYIIVLVKNAKDSMEETFFEIEKNNDILLSMNLPEYYEYLDNLIDFIDRLLAIASKHKDKSEMFMECYNAIDELLTTVVYTTTEIGYIESKMLERLENAS